jgi:hypothetical protein
MMESHERAALKGTRAQRLNSWRALVQSAICVAPERHPDDPSEYCIMALCVQISISPFSREKNKTQLCISIARTPDVSPRHRNNAISGPRVEKKTIGIKEKDGEPLFLGGVPCAAEQRVNH